jgi:hypothetical protein
MEIANDTPFAIATVLWEDVEGHPNLSVIAKGTFAVIGGKSVIAGKQIPIFKTDLHFQDDPTASVEYETDMVPGKPRADVVLVGQAHAPGERPVKELEVMVRVGKFSKTIRVIGNRRWLWPSAADLSPTISYATPFATMDLVYERAYGGIDTAAAFFCRENLIGTGAIGAYTRESIHGTRLPNLEDPRNPIRSWDSRPKPAGFGFYGRGWMPRLRHAGTYDEKHMKERAPAFPKDFSYEFFNGAHPDLQVQGYLRGDETVELQNLSREPRMEFHLPGVVPRITVTKWTVSPDDWIERRVAEGEDARFDQVPTSEEYVQANLDTLVLIPEEGIFYEVFRGVFPLSGLSSPEVARIKVSA